MWLGVRNNNEEYMIGTRKGVFRARAKKWSTTPWRLADVRWTAGRPQVRVDPMPPPLMPFDGVRVYSERITKQDIEAPGATLECPECDAIKGGKRPQAHLDQCRNRTEESVKATPQEAGRLDR